MLSGIKTGKRKKKAPPGESNRIDDPKRQSEEIRGNAAVAAALRQQLAMDPTARPTADTPDSLMIPDRQSLTASRKKEEDMTVQELLVHEKSHMTMAEQESRDILRRKKMKRPRMTVDSDNEEVEEHWQPSDLSTRKASRRDADRQRAVHRQHGISTSSCWWWIESTRFVPDRQLIAASPHVTLVINARGLLPGKHVFLVPIPHASSWTACEDHVWTELRQFQSSLRAMARANQEAVIFWETVLASSRGGIWQTRMEALFVPTTVAQDAPLYFRSALSEQAEEFGTHQKLMVVKKNLKSCVPQKFDYFYVEYGEYDGHLQMIESRSFPKDFGVDTIAGMMELDPLKFRATNTFVDEHKLKRDFVAKWDDFDWTVTSGKSTQPATATT